MDRLESMEKKVADMGIAILCFKSQSFPCLCAVTEDGHRAIGIDKEKLTLRSSYLVGITHELSHLETETYRPLSTDTYESVDRDERKAWERTVSHLVPLDDLENAMCECKGEVWAMAEMLGVTEQLVRKALDKYRRKGYIDS